MKFSKTFAVAFILIGCICVFGQKNDGKLEIATYMAKAQETRTTSFGATGFFSI